MGISYRVRELAARGGLRLLKASGWFDGYWQPWRGDFFDEAEAAGLHILPVHYYSPVPSRADRTRRPLANSMAGIALDVPAAAAIAGALLGAHEPGIRRLLTGRASGTSRFDPTNSAFHPLDAALLYAVIQHERPSRIVEIGSGNSTLVMADAARDLKAATGRSPTISCIEPYLPDYLRPTPPEVTEILEQPLQDVPLDRFTGLEAGDILFIDSTHVVRHNSDVLYEILEILPRLAAGVIVHVHDIFLPADYPDQWLDKDRFFWTEQYMLQAFLSMNAAYRIEIPGSAIRPLLTGEPRALIEVSNSDVSPGSFWMRRQ